MNIYRGSYISHWDSGSFSPQLKSPLCKASHHGKATCKLWVIREWWQVYSSCDSLKWPLPYKHLWSQASGWPVTWRRHWGEKELSFTEHFLGVRHKAVCFPARHFLPITQDAGNACRQDLQCSGCHEVRALNNIDSRRRNNTLVTNHFDSHCVCSPN